MKAALRMMTWFGVPEPLIGDVVEGVDRHSTQWAWIQTCVAIGQTTSSVVTRRPRDAGRVVAISLGSVFITYESVLNVYLWANGLPPFIQLHGETAPLFLFIWKTYALPLAVLWCACAFVAGWFAVWAAHQNERAAFAPIAAIAQVLHGLWWALPISVGLLDRVLLHQMPLKFAVSWALGWVGSVFVTAIGMPLCGLLGAAWSASRNAGLATGAYPNVLDAGHL